VTDHDLRGAELARRFFAGVVEPLLSRAVPGLRYAAARLGSGSDVLGLDDAMSRDHDWGCRLTLLVDEEILDRLTAITGIGPWTVHGMLIIALDRADVVLPGDLALRKAIQRSYQLDHLPSQQEVLSVAEPWRPYRSLATAYLFQVALDDPGAPLAFQSS
jgi:hypothetical protein